MPDAIRPKTEREIALEALLKRMLWAVHDLDVWEEIDIDFQSMIHDAEQLGINVKDWSWSKSN